MKILNRGKVAPLRPDDVIWAYRHFLKREPESSEAVDGHVAGCKDLRHLVEVFTSSEEYQFNKFTNTPEEIFYFFHIAKTGGMSVHEYLHSSVKTNELLPGYMVKDFINSNPRSFKYFSGHFRNLPLKLNVRRVSLATVIRNPIDRTISHYMYAKKNPNTKQNEDVKNITLENVLFGDLANTFYGNFQARLLAELSPLSEKYLNNGNFITIDNERLFDLAMDGLSKVEVLGITEKLDDFIDDMSKKWNLPKPKKKIS